jgi:hypothetical protein
MEVRVKAIAMKFGSDAAFPGTVSELSKVQPAGKPVRKTPNR